MGGHKPFDVRSGDLFYFDPDDLVLRNDARSKLPIKDGFVHNIMKNGVIKPVIIAKDGDKAVVDDGQQRVRHAREANKLLREQGGKPILVPCVYRRGGDLARLSVRISANEFGQHDDILAKAKLVEHALAIGASEEDCALDFGVDVITIRSWMKLQEAGREIQDAVVAGRLSASAGIQLAALPREMQEQTLVELEAQGGRITTKRARQAARKEPSAPQKRLRPRSVIEAAMAHQPVFLRTLDGFRVLNWVMGWEEIKELDLPE
jgi:ParB family chromosome partitioning protein